jgi:hypothetical protein
MLAPTFRFVQLVELFNELTKPDRQGLLQNVGVDPLKVLSDGELTWRSI